MRETIEDLDRLQHVLDQSYAEAGPHLLTIHTPERRMTAEELAEALRGVCVLTVATVSAGCEPIAGPVDRLDVHLSVPEQ